MVRDVPPSSIFSAVLTSSIVSGCSIGHSGGVDELDNFVIFSCTIDVSTNKVYVLHLCKPLISVPVLTPVLKRPRL